MDERNLIKTKTLFTQTFNNDHGIRALRFIKDLCGYDKSNRIINRNGEIPTHLLAYHEGQRDIYLTLREYLSEEILFKTEIKGMGTKKQSTNLKDKKDDRSSTK